MENDQYIGRNPIIINLFNIFIKPKVNNDHPDFQRLIFLNVINFAFVFVIFFRLLTFIGADVFSSSQYLFRLIFTLFLGLLFIFQLIVGKSRYYKLSLYSIMIFPLFLFIWGNNDLYQSDPLVADQILVNPAFSLAVGIVLAGLLYNSRSIIFLSILSVIDLYLFYSVYLGFEFSYITPKLIFLLITSILVYITIIFRDNTLKKLSKQSLELKLQKEKAESGEKAKSSFLANVSHELRTPLHAIQGYVKLISDNRNSPETPTYTKRLNMATRTLQTIVDDVLNYTMFEKEKITLSQDPFHLEDLLEILYLENSSSSNMKGLELTFVKENDIPLNLIGDEIRLKQILNNLLNNAVKFTNEGSITLKIRKVSENAKSSSVVLNFQVIDTGIGIKAETKKNIFKPFFQGEILPKKSLSGLGLGLSIVANLIQLMNGEISLIDNSKGGSIFDVKLPFKVNFDTINSSNENINVTNTSGFNKILITDDNEDNLDLLSIYLQPLNVSIIKAKNGLEAFELVKKENFDLIIMDIRMPVMDGLEAVQKILAFYKQENKDPPPIVALTAYVYSDQIDQIKRAGFSKLLTKPSSQIEILELFQEYKKRIS